MYTYSSCLFAVLHKVGVILTKEKASGSQLCPHRVSALPAPLSSQEASAVVLHQYNLQYTSESPLGSSELHNGASNPRRTSVVIRSIWIPKTFLFFQFLTVTTQAACWKASKKWSKETTNNSNQESTSLSYYLSYHLTAASLKWPPKI